MKITTLIGVAAGAVVVAVVAYMVGASSGPEQSPVAEVAEPPAATAGAATLDNVKAAGVLKCGINTGLPGFAYTDDDGKWTGFDVAYCRALAGAVLGDPEKIEFVNLTGANRFPALQSGEIDVLSRNTTWTFSRDVDLGFTLWA